MCQVGDLVGSWFVLRRGLAVQRIEVGERCSSQLHSVAYQFCFNGQVQMISLDGVL